MPLIGKKNIKGAGHQSKLYCVANYEDDLELPKNKVTQVYSNDGVEIYILYEEELKKYLKELEEMECFIYRVKDPNTTKDDITNVVRMNRWNGDADSRYEEVTFVNWKK